ncbi:MAG: RHS repeat protein, partial [Xanthomonadaceae bacterium]|nr:RHS repeat protein [Xanthomonadaceae bacterium]
MDGFKMHVRSRACRALGLAAVAIMLAGEVRAQTQCDTGDPCARADIASHAGIGPITGVNNPIDVVSGNKYQGEVDFRLAGELGLSFARHYNSASVQGSAFGGGWNHSYETALVREERESGTTITIVQADGRRIEFHALGPARDGVRRYVSKPFGYGVVEEDVARIEALRQSGDQTAVHARPWRWRWLDGRELIFDERGALRRLQTASGEWLALDYDAHRRLERIIDFAGRTLRLSYWDRPSEWLQPFDDSQVRGARHRLASLTLPDGRVIRYGYDGNGLLSDVRFDDGTRKRYEYARSGDALKLARVLDRSGRIAGTYGYGANGDARSSTIGESDYSVRLERLDPSTASDTGTTLLTNEAGERTAFRWRRTPFGTQLLQVVGAGCPTCPASNVRYRYDEYGHVDRIDKLDADSSRVQWSEIIARDEIGRVLERHREQDDARTLIERYEYASDDPLAKPMRILRPSIAPGRSRTFALRYNARGQPLQLIEVGYAPVDGGLGYARIERSTSYRYYEAPEGASHLVGRLKTIDGPLPGDVDLVHYDYDARGLLARIAYANGAMERFEYDSLGRLHRYVPLDGVPIELEYDDEGRVSGYARAGLQTRIAYDADGRLARLNDPIGQQISFEYDGPLLKALQDTGGNRIEFDLDAAGRPVARRLLNPDGTVAQIGAPHGENATDLNLARSPFSPETLAFVRLPIAKSWTTEAVALIEPVSAVSSPLAHREVVDERGLASHYRYDDFGRLVHVLSPDAGSLILEYDEASRVVARHFADGRTIHYAYDLLGRIETISAGSERIAVAYGPYNKPAKIRYAWGDESFEYDFAGRLVQRTQRIDGHIFTRSYRYDALGRRSEDTLPDGTTLVYRYNGSVHAKPGVLSSIERKGLLRSKPIVTGLNEASDSYSRSTSRFGNGLEFERELDVHGRLRRYGTPGIAHFELETDGDARIASVHHGRKRFFSYDSAGRLERASFSDAEADAAAFGFDIAGNVRLSTFQGTSTLLRVDATSNRLLERTDADGTRLRYAYDLAGRTTRIGERTFEYDAFGRMIRVSDGGRALAEYSYNAFGERIRKVVYSGSGRSVAYFFYDGSKLTAEADEEGAVAKQFVYVRDRVVAMLVGASTYAVHTDWLGTPMAVTDERQRVVWRAKIDPLGRIRSQRGSIRLDLRGSNHYFDGETGFHYNIHRYFDPATSRYLTPDPIGQLGGLNLYAFANGDPINFVDPLGLQALPADFDYVDRFSVFIRAGLEALPAELVDSIGAALRELLDPATIATAAAVFAAWALSHLTPFGWAADLVIIGVGVAFMGAAIVDLARGTLAAYRRMDNAQTYQELCAAGRDLASTVSDAVLELAGGGGLATSARTLGPQVAAQIRRMFGRGSRPPPPAPLLWTQEMPQRVS